MRFEAVHFSNIGEMLDSFRDDYIDRLEVAERDPGAYLAGFHTAVDTLLPILEDLVHALNFYAIFETWDTDKFLCGSDRMRSDLEETEYSRFTPGHRARMALNLLKKRF